MKKIIGCLLLFVASCAHAEIQCDNAPAKRFMHKYDAPYPELFSNPDMIFKHYKILRNMLGSLSGVNREVTSDILEQVSSLQTQFDFMQDLSDAYIKMCLVSDAAIIKKTIDGNNGSLQTSCNDELETLNKRLTLLSNKALISEVEKTRDDITKSCSDIRVWAEQLH